MVREFGPPSVLVATEVPDPVPGEADVRVIIKPELKKKPVSERSG